MVVVAPHQFYITQLIPRPLVPYGEPYTFGKLQVLYESLVKRSSNVYFCQYEAEKGLRCRVAAAGFMTANGITKNKNGTQIYVADTIAKTFVIFSRNTTTNGLKTADILNIGHSLDNLKYDATSDSIYTGSLFKLFQAKQVDARYPNFVEEDRGGVIELKSYTEQFTGLQKWRLRRHVVTNKLNGISGSVRIGDKLYIGSHMHEGVLVCPI